MLPLPVNRCGLHEARVDTAWRDGKYSPGEKKYFPLTVKCNTEVLKPMPPQAKGIYYRLFHTIVLNNVRCVCAEERK